MVIERIVKQTVRAARTGAAKRIASKRSAKPIAHA
jgi:hypothetical protein